MEGTKLDEVNKEWLLRSQPISSIVGGALKTQYSYKAAYESERIYLSYLALKPQGRRQKNKKSRVNYCNLALV